MGRRVAVLMTTIALMLAPTTAEARPRTYVTDCAHARIRPDSILFACADGGYYVRQLEWSTWRVRTAIARGVFHENDCEPNCADGTFHHSRGKLRLSGRLWCREIERYVFRWATVVYDRPLLGTSTVRLRMVCPF